MIDKLSLLVAEAFKNCKENDYSFDDYTDEEIAYDMIAYHDDISEYEHHEVLHYVKIHRNNN